MSRHPTEISSFTLCPLAQVEVQEIDGAPIGQLRRLRLRSGGAGTGEAVTDVRICELLAEIEVRLGTQPVIAF
jgi:hypothetical protein